jgi:hypothetical protein
LEEGREFIGFSLSTAWHFSAFCRFFSAFKLVRVKECSNSELLTYFGKADPEIWSILQAREVVVADE